jgi:hypothetical protein
VTRFFLFFNLFLHFFFFFPPASGVQAKDGNKAGLEALGIYKGHTSVVQDVAWHATCPSIFGSVGEPPPPRTCLLVDELMT